MRNFHAIAALRGDGLRPELQALFDRMATDPRSELFTTDDGMVQAGPNPVAEMPANSINGCADLSFARRLACFRWHDDGAGAGVMIVGERSLPDAITSHSSIK
jgi:hypothetical protein